MTCIVGLVHEGKVYIGGDRSAVDGWNRMVSNEPKLFRIGEILIGMSGSHLVSQILKHEFKPSRAQYMDETDLHYLVTVFGKEVRQLVSALINKRDDDGEAIFSGGALIGYRGKLYRMSSNCQVDWFERRYDAVGSGAAFALGSIATNSSNTPTNILFDALRVASLLCVDVCAPYDVKSLVPELDESR